MTRTAPRRVARSILRRGWNTSKPRFFIRLAAAMCSCFGCVRAQYQAGGTMVCISEILKLYFPVRNGDLRAAAASRSASFVYTTVAYLFRDQSCASGKKLSLIANHSLLGLHL